jgi:HAMP domain-containing protein
MAAIDTAINELQGSLFEAATGGASAADSADTLVTALTSLKTVVDVVLVPFKEFVRLAGEAATKGTLAAEATKQMAIAEGEFNTSLANTKKSMSDNAEGIAEIHKQYLSVFGTRKDMAVFETSEDIRKFAAVRRELEAGALRIKMSKDVMAAERGAADQRQKERVRYIADTLKKYPNIRQEMIEGMADEFVGRDADAIARIDAARSKALARSAQSGTREIMSQIGSLTYYEELGQLIDNAVKKKEELAATPAVKFEPVNTSNRTRSNAPAGVPAGEPVAVEETSEAKMFREMGEYMENGRKAQAEASAKAYADGLAAHVAAFRAAEAEKEAIRLAGIEKDKADEQAAFDFRKGLAEDLFQVKAKLLVQEMVAGKSATKVAAEMARKAIGDAISAKGDEAMAQAAIYAASFNPMAIPMAAAGVAAYAAAAALGSSAKKSSSGTPASAAPAQAAPVNTSFNLRVDAAFADGESIARQFAMMQRSAQRRGLVPVGA